ncbi:MAG: amidase family protein, partial [Chloroflexota bacterium]
MSTDELCFLTLAQQAQLLRARVISPVELLRSTLRQVERVDPSVNAYITLLAEDAMREAEAAERDIADGLYLGPLHGVPVALKDLFFTAGIRTTAGSKILRDFVPDEDATVVTR